MIMRICERLLRAGCVLTLVVGLLLVFAPEGASQIRGLPPVPTFPPNFGVPFPPNMVGFMGIGGGGGLMGGRMMGMQGGLIIMSSMPAGQLAQSMFSSPVQSPYQGGGMGM